MKSWLSHSLVPRVSHLPAPLSERGGRVTGGKMNERPREQGWIRKLSLLNVFVNFLLLVRYHFFIHWELLHFLAWSLVLFIILYWFISPNTTFAQQFPSWVGEKEDYFLFLRGYFYLWSFFSANRLWPQLSIRMNSKRPVGNWLHLQSVCLSSKNMHYCIQQVLNTPEIINILFTEVEVNIPHFHRHWVNNRFSIYHKLNN